MNLIKIPRSYAVRSSRLSEAQERLLRQQWHAYGTSLPELPPLDFDNLFNRRTPRVIEIGFGNGASLVEMANNHPGQDFLGIEVYRKGLAQCLGLAVEHKLTNLRRMSGDALEILRFWIPDRSVARIQVLFPDPWPKARHRKRRLIRDEFLLACARTLEPRGILHVATDWDDYADHITKLLAEHEAFRPWTPTGNPEPEGVTQPRTRYENRGIRLGHRIHDLYYRLDGN